MFNGWEIPVEAVNPVVALDVLQKKPYLMPYISKMFPEEEYSGFLSDIWNSIKKGTEYIWDWVKRNQAIVIPTVAVGGAMLISKDVRKNAKYILPALGVYTLGYYLYKYHNNPDQVIQQGTKQVAQKVETAKQAGTASDLASKNPFWQQLLSEAGKIGLTYLIYKQQLELAKKVREQAQKRYEQARRGEVPPSQAPGSVDEAKRQIIEQTLAYAIQHRDELAQLGFSTPEEAVVAILQATGGNPPPPTMSAFDLFRGTTALAPRPSGRFSEFLSKYWWVIAGAVVAFMLFREREKK